WGESVRDQSPASARNARFRVPQYGQPENRLNSRLRHVTQVIIYSRPLQSDRTSLHKEPQDALPTKDITPLVRIQGTLPGYHQRAAKFPPRTEAGSCSDPAAEPYQIPVYHP